VLKHIRRTTPDQPALLGGAQGIESQKSKAKSCMAGFVRHALIYRQTNLVPVHLRLLLSFGICSIRCDVFFRNFTTQGTKMKKVIAALVLSLFVAACANQREFIKTYDGPALSSDNSALLKPSMEAVITAIDGDRKKSFSAMRAGSPNVDADISFTPGMHQILVRYSKMTPTGQITSNSDIAVNFTATVGHRYILDAITNGNSWAPQIIDVTDKPDLWCLWIDHACMKDRFNQGPSAPIPQDKIK
jgi:hypothetical protein